MDRNRWNRARVARLRGWHGQATGRPWTAVHHSHASPSLAWSWRVSLASRATIDAVSSASDSPVMTSPPPIRAMGRRAVRSADCPACTWPRWSGCAARSRGPNARSRPSSVGSGPAGARSLVSSMSQPSGLAPPPRVRFIRRSAPSTCRDHCWHCRVTFKRRRRLAQHNSCRRLRQRDRGPRSA
jgi:hypothetical protein